jgi:hypothetical protein
VGGGAGGYLKNVAVSQKRSRAGKLYMKSITNAMCSGALLELFKNGAAECQNCK